MRERERGSDVSFGLRYVLAFAMSTFSTTESRTGKPFNPLLGETYEMVRPDRGYRCIVEQVQNKNHTHTISLDALADLFFFFFL